MHNTGGWLKQFKDLGIKTMVRDTKYGFLTFPYKFKKTGETTVSTAPITVTEDGDITWSVRKGPLTKSGKRMFIRDILSVPPGTVAAVARAMNEMAGKIGGEEVQAKSAEKEIKIEQAKTDDEALARRLKILGLNK